MNPPLEEAIQILKKIKARGSTTQVISRRSEIILTYLKRKHVQLVVQDLECHISTVYKWSKRWKSHLPDALEQWNEKGFNRENAILEILQDAPRSGKPATFSLEQITRIIALACRDPEEFGRPITHWSMGELADEAVKQGIVKSISEATLRRFLKSGRVETAQKPILAQPQNR